MALSQFREADLRARCVRPCGASMGEFGPILAGLRPQICDPACHLGLHRLDVAQPHGHQMARPAGPRHGEENTPKALVVGPEGVTDLPPPSTRRAVADRCGLLGCSAACRGWWREHPRGRRIWRQRAAMRLRGLACRIAAPQSVLERRPPDADPPRGRQARPSRTPGSHSRCRSRSPPGCAPPWQLRGRCRGSAVRLSGLGAGGGVASAPGHAQFLSGPTACL